MVDKHQILDSDGSIAIVVQWQVLLEESYAICCRTINEASHVQESVIKFQAFDTAQFVVQKNLGIREDPP